MYKSMSDFRLMTTKNGNLPRISSLKLTEPLGAEFKLVSEEITSGFLALKVTQSKLDLTPLTYDNVQRTHVQR